MDMFEARHRLQVRKSDLSGSTFDDVNLSGCAFHNVNLSGANLDDINLSGWRVCNANMSGLHLDHVNLSGASITHARLNGARIDGIDIQEMLAFWRAGHEGAAMSPTMADACDLGCGSIPRGLIEISDDR